MKSLIMILIPLALTGCAAVQYNDGKTVSIQSDGWYGLDSLQKTAPYGAFLAPTNHNQ